MSRQQFGDYILGALIAGTGIAMAHWMFHRHG